MMKWKKKEIKNSLKKFDKLENIIYKKVELKYI